MAAETPRSADGEYRRPGILIVEDETDLAETCVRFLRRLGYHTRVAQTGSEALAAITADPPDLVIADVRLRGEMDGFDVVRYARRREPRISAIVWTAQSSEQTRQTALDAGAVGYLPKPFTLAELRAAVDRALPQGRGTDGKTPGEG
jgi:DNA-binding response OmpR family regulator